MAKPVDIRAAKTHFSQLVDRAGKGEEIIISKAGRPVARLMPLAAPARRLRPGLLKGRIKISADFDSPLPEEILREFEGR